MDGAEVFGVLIGIVIGKIGDCDCWIDDGMAFELYDVYLRLFWLRLRFYWVLCYDCSMPNGTIYT